MARPSKHEYFLRMAELAATRSTCLRRAVGCVLVNARGHVLATGYNGRPSGMRHCNDDDYGAAKQLIGQRADVTKVVLPRGRYPHACPGAAAASGTQLDGCEAIHAEMNAITQCPNAWDIDVCYCTASPCIACVKVLLNTSCRAVFFREEYPHPQARQLWESVRQRGWHFAPTEKEAQ